MPSAKCQVRPALRVVGPPVLEQRLDELAGEQLVPDPRAEGLDVGVLPGRAELDVARSGTREAAPVAQRVRGQLRAVVRADVLGGAATKGRQTIKHRHRGVCVDVPLAADGERLAGVLVDDVQELDDPTVLSLGEL